MKTIKYLYEGIAPSDNLISLAGQDDILFFDIETTGLSKVKNQIYLIGIGYYSDEGLNVIQWFAEVESEESLVLKAFTEFSSSYACLINYNGRSFDIPFTMERMSKYGLSMPDFTSVDLYTYTKPLKKILSLDDLTQKSIERFLGIKREDKYNGGELISIYKKYTRYPSQEYLKLLLLHNKEDVLNMHYLTDILDYKCLPDINIEYKNTVQNDYRDYNSISKTEYIIYGLHNLVSLPKGFNAFKSSEYGSLLINVMNTGELSLRIPVFSGTLYYYFDNYKDYYYLPAEDICILKSMAGGVAKENRINATKETCRIALNDTFLPFPSEYECDNTIKLFKDTYKSKHHFIRTDDYLNMTDSQKSELLFHIYKYFFI